MSFGADPCPSPTLRRCDRVGCKTVYLLGLGTFTVVSAACAAAPSVLALVIARAIQAVGAGMVFPAALGLLLPEWPVEKRGIPVGIWSAVSGVAAAAGPPVGALLVEAGWRWVFIANVPIGIAFFAVGLRVLLNRRDEHATGRPDVIGAGLFTAAIAALLRQDSDVRDDERDEVVRGALQIGSRRGVARGDHVSLVQKRQDGAHDQRRHECVLQPLRGHA